MYSCKLQHRKENICHELLFISVNRVWQLNEVIYKGLSGRTEWNGTAVVVFGWLTLKWNPLFWARVSSRYRGRTRASHFRCKRFKMFKSAICFCRMFLHRKHCFCADGMSISSRNSSSTMNGKHATVVTWSTNWEGQQCAFGIIFRGNIINLSSLKLVKIIFKDSCRTLQKTHCVSITMTNWIMVFIEKKNMFPLTHTKHINIFCV